MLPSALDRPRATRRIRQGIARASALLLAGLLTSGALLATAAPAQATPVPSIVLDGVTYTSDPGHPEAGATATAFDTSFGTVVTIPSAVSFAPGAPAIPVTTIGDAAFQSSGLTSLDIAGSVTSIGESAFEDNSLTQLTLREGLVTIGIQAFAGAGISTVRIPDSVTTIGTYAFVGNSLTSVTLPSKLTEISDFAFAANELTTIDIPDTVTRIGDSAFMYNHVGSVVIPNSVTTIERGAFMANCLTSLTIGTSVTSIGLGAFMWNSLTSVVLPASLRTIDGSAFNQNSTFFLTVPLAPNWDPKTLSDEDSTLRSVTFTGRPPAGFVPTTGPLSGPNTNTDYETMGSLGAGYRLTVNYPLAFASSDPTAGFTAGSWQGYSTAPFVAVNFEMGGHGDQVAVQRIAPGSKPTKPAAAPSATGWTFTGWFADSALSTSFDFTSPVAADTTAYAGWTEIVIDPPATTVTVNFDLQGHGAPIDSQVIAAGSRATLPTAPTASGFTFTGWFTDASLGTTFDFDTALTASATVYAGWTQNAVVTPPTTDTPLAKPTALASTGVSGIASVLLVALAVLVAGGALLFTRAKLRRN